MWTLMDLAWYLLVLVGSLMSLLGPFPRPRTAPWIASGISTHDS